MRVIVGVVAAFLAGLALAAGVAVGVTLMSGPDKGVQLENVSKPNPWFGSTDYGRR